MRFALIDVLLFCGRQESSQKVLKRSTFLEKFTNGAWQGLSLWWLLPHPRDGLSISRRGQTDADASIKAVAEACANVDI